MDDIETIRRRRAIKVIITDIIMAVSVVAIVAILVAAVAGWRINSDFTVEQNGLLSVKTFPAGAKIIVDDKELEQVSNFSKMLSGGKHNVVLQRDGYESWKKTIEITPGWLTRLEYARLFKQNRDKNIIRSFEDLDFYNVSPSRSAAIFGENGSTKWTIVKNFNSAPTFEQVDIKGIFTNTSDGTFPYEINSIEWSKLDTKLLVSASRIDTKGKLMTEWCILDLADIKNSVNISINYPRYEANSKVSLANIKDRTLKNLIFKDPNGEEVLGLVSSNLVVFDINDKAISELVLKNVAKFTYHDLAFSYLTLPTKNTPAEIRFLYEENTKPTVVAELPNNKAKATFVSTRFNSMDYIIYTIDDNLYIQRMNDFPRNGAKLPLKPFLKLGLNIAADTAEVSANNEFIIFKDGTRIAVYDTELEEVYEYDYEDKKFRFLDNFILYRTDEKTGNLLAWDFDHTNVRTLVVDKSVNDYDALISPNNKFFYYFAKSETGVDLVQEKL